MTFSRKKFIRNSLGFLALPFVNGYQLTDSRKNITENDPLPDWKFSDLSLTIKEAVIVQSVELVKTQGQLFIMVRANNGMTGITQCNDRMPHLVSLLKGLVIPHFLNKDARDIALLSDNAYRLNSNYKYSGMPLWNCIGSVENAVWDLLGHSAGKPVFELLGKPLRSSYGIYISDWNREGDADKIAEQLAMKLEATGAKGVKIKTGGRMSNSPENAAHIKRFLPVLRKKLGDEAIIYADANGSYSAEEGIETGKLLEDYGVEIFEEPCNFEDEEATAKVSSSLKKIKLAGGEQDNSPYRFRRLAEKNIYQILQPDLYYNGGILKTLQVAVIAQKYGALGLAPHSPKADPLIGPFWQVAALIPNLYGLQETVYNPGEKMPSWYSGIKISGGKINIPSTHGLGIEYEPGIWKSVQKII